MHQIKKKVKIKKNHYSLIKITSIYIPIIPYSLYDVLLLYNVLELKEKSCTNDRSNVTNQTRRNVRYIVKSGGK